MNQTITQDWRLKSFFREFKELSLVEIIKYLKKTVLGFLDILENLVKESTVRADNLKKIFVNENLSDSSKKTSEQRLYHSQGNKKIKIQNK